MHAKSSKDYKFAKGEKRRKFNLMKYLLKTT